MCSAKQLQLEILLAKKAWQEGQISDNDSTVLTEIILHQQNGIFSASVYDVSEHANVSPAVVRGCIRRLERLKYIRFLGRGVTNQYELLLNKKMESQNVG